MAPILAQDLLEAGCVPRPGQILDLGAQDAAARVFNSFTQGNEAEKGLADGGLTGRIKARKYLVSPE